MSGPGFRVSLLISTEGPCSYLPDRLSRSAFLGQTEPISAELYTALLQNGFRRSGSDIYRPACLDCNACQPVRVVVDEFQPDRRQRRILKRNQALRIEVLRPPLDEEQYALYARYIEARHREGGMYPPDREQFERFLTAPWSDTLLLCLRQEEQLIGVLVADRSLDGLSAVYSFFTPELAAQSLGSLLVLHLLELCRTLGLPYCYLGYYIRDCRKMNYKTEYQPLQCLLDGKWQPLPLC